MRNLLSGASFVGKAISLVLAACGFHPSWALVVLSLSSLTKHAVDELCDRAGSVAKAALPASLPSGAQARLVLVIAPICGGLLFLSGCATTGGSASGSVAADVTTDLGQGLVVAQDVFTAANAVEENNTGGKLNAAKVLSDAQAAETSANSAGLATAVDVLVSDVNSQIAAAQAQGATPAAVITTAASTAATAQVTAATTPVPTPPPSSSSSLWRPSTTTDLALR